MILYRPHRGSLADAMAELREFNNMFELVDFLSEKYKSNFSYSFQLYGSEDNRIGWKSTYIILNTGANSPGFITMNLTKEESLKIYRKWMSEEEEQDE